MSRFIALFAMAATLVLCGCGRDSSRRSDEGETAEVNCTEPENPYSEGTGHYAGYQWAQDHESGDCNTSSQSFNEGCEEYESQESEYQECEAQKKR